MAVIVHKLVSPCMVCIRIRYVPCPKKKNKSALFKSLHRITELEFLVGGTQESAFVTSLLPPPQFPRKWQETMGEGEAQVCPVERPITGLPTSAGGDPALPP